MLPLAAPISVMPGPVEKFALIANGCKGLLCASHENHAEGE
jgi:hypothetical protein